MVAGLPAYNCCMSESEERGRVVFEPLAGGGSVLRTSVWLPVRRSEVFEFFADAMRLESITPAWLHFQVLTPAPIPMAPGALIDYRLRLHGLPIHWQTEIAAWDPPHKFVDRQRVGPYLGWEHLHTFADQQGGTLVEDRVEYRVPGGWLVDRLLVRRDLRRIFEFRLERLLAHFSGTGSETSLSRSSG